MKKHLLLPMALLLLAFSSCTKEDQVANVPGSADQKAKSTHDNSSGHLKIAVLSDIHYMDKSLMNGDMKTDTLFQKDITPNKAMQEYSIPIFRKVIAELMSERPDIVLIAGDLAKSGEAISHKTVDSLLRTLKEKGIKIYIAPGNNDINNKNAYSYNNGVRTRVPNVTADQFVDRYKNFGYGDDTFVDKDPASLSYIAAPYPGLWILSIDAAGAIKEQTMGWIKSKLEEAQNANITVLGLMHYSLVEHVQDINNINPSVIKDWAITANGLAAAGLKVIFTGHGHVNDITMHVSNGHTLYDVETGSLVTPPISYRMMMLKNKELDMDTRYITSIDVPLPDNKEFTAYAQSELAGLLNVVFSRFLKPIVDSALIPEAVPLIRNAYMAHLAGDEKLPPQEQLRIDAFSRKEEVANFSKITFSQSIWAYWTDINTKDHKWHIKLTNP